MLPAWVRVRAGAKVIPELVMPAIFFVGLAWFNCFAIANWEKVRHSRRSPSVNNAGPPKVFLIACVLGMTGLGTALLLATVAPRAALLLAMGTASAFLLGTLEVVRPRLSAVTLRTCADLVLLTPACLFALPGLHG